MTCSVIPHCLSLSSVQNKRNYEYKHNNILFYFCFGFCFLNDISVVLKQDFVAVFVLVFCLNCIWLEFQGVCSLGLVATADLIISYPMQLSATPHLTNIFSYYLLLKYIYICKYKYRYNANIDTNTNTDTKFQLPHTICDQYFHLLSCVQICKYQLKYKYKCI